MLHNELNQLKEGDLPEYNPFQISDRKSNKSSAEELCVFTNIESSDNLMEDINILHENLTRK